MNPIFHHTKKTAMKLLTALLCTLALGACSSKPPEPKVTPASASSAPTAPDALDAVKANQQRVLAVQKALQDDARHHGAQIPPLDSNQPQQPSQQ